MPAQPFCFRKPGAKGACQFFGYWKTFPQQGGNSGRHLVLVNRCNILHLAARGNTGPQQGQPDFAGAGNEGVVLVPFCAPATTMIGGDKKRCIVAVNRVGLHKVPEVCNHFVNSTNLLQVEIILSFVRKFIGFAQA